MSEKQVVVFPAIKARFELLNQRVDLPQHSRDAQDKIRNAAKAYANAILSAIEPGTVMKDTGRIIAALDLIQQSKNCACDALILPHVKIQ